MTKSICVLTATLLFVILPIVCDEVADQSAVNETPEPPVEGKILASSHDDSSTKAKPIPLSRTSGVVFDDGSFEFNIHNANISIHVRGEVKQIEERRTLVINGTYDNMDTEFIVQFSGSEKGGFILTALDEIPRLPPRIITSIIG